MSSESWGPVAARFGSASGGAVPGYSAAAAAHMVEEFLEMRLGYNEFWAWLMSYPAHRPGLPPDFDVEDELNRAILALMGMQHGTRDWPMVDAELRDIRSRLTGLARS